jgi:hypothetical protein
MIRRLLSSRSATMDTMLRPCAPRELAGRWVAYSADGLHIIASGETFTEVWEKARRETTERVSFEKLPPLARSPLDHG